MESVVIVGGDYVIISVDDGVFCKFDGGSDLMDLFWVGFMYFCVVIW